MSIIEAADSETDTPRKTLLLIHGGGQKPAQGIVQRIWLDAMKQGLARDYPETHLDDANVSLVYYADLTAAITPNQKPYDPVIDAADRENTLARLADFSSSKKFRRVHYESLPGKSSLKEFLMDIGAPVSNVLGLGQQRIAHVLPELVTYWDNEGDYGTQIRQRLHSVLAPALERGDDIMLISHGIGSVFAYDVFCELNHSAQSTATRKVRNWVTLGAPLADNYVRSRLGKAAGSTAESTYPNTLVNWFNIAAEDDFICHDETVANDFSAMLKNHVISRIEDFNIYNLAVRFGRSNPHNSTGYLIHPRLIKLLSDWLKQSHGI